MAGNELNNNNASGVFKAEQHSGFSSTILSSFSVPDMGGIAWDGTDVIWGGGTVGASNSIKKGTGFTGTIQASFNGPSATDRTYDLDYAGSNVLIAINTTKIYQMSGFSSTVSSSITVTGAAYRGVSWDGTNLLAADPAHSPEIKKFSGFSTTVTSSFTQSNPRGVAWNTDTSGIITTQVDAGGAKHRLRSGFSSTVDSSWTNATLGSSLGIGWQAAAAPAAETRDARKLLLLGVG